MPPKPNWFDWLIYRLFRWRWNRLFRGNDKLRQHFVNCWNFSEQIEAVERFEMRTTQEPTTHAQS